VDEDDQEVELFLHPADGRQVLARAEGGMMLRWRIACLTPLVAEEEGGSRGHEG